MTLEPHATPLPVRRKSNSGQILSRAATRLALMLALGAITAQGLTACTALSEKVSGWLTSDAPAYAVLDGRILRGDLRFTSDREARAQLQTSDLPELVCVGPLRYNATTMANLDLNCSNGLIASLPIQPLSTLRGQGRGKANEVQGNAEQVTGDLAITFGLTPAQAAAYLQVPIQSLLPPVPVATVPVK